jgi:hypothetical protein
MALSRRFSGFAGWLAGAMIVGTLAGCAAAPEQAPEAAVQARAQGRWDALVKGDIGGAYAFLSPGSRAVLDADSYRDSVRRGFWKSAKVQRAECSSADACEVSVEIEYEFRGSRVKTPLQESWIRQEGNWWYVLK